jgi:hypothetical protein
MTFDPGDRIHDPNRLHALLSFPPVDPAPHAGVATVVNFNGLLGTLDRPLRSTRGRMRQAHLRGAFRTSASLERLPASARTRQGGSDTWEAFNRQRPSLSAETTPNRVPVRELATMTSAPAEACPDTESERPPFCQSAELI